MNYFFIIKIKAICNWFSFTKLGSLPVSQNSEGSYSINFRSVRLNDPYWEKMWYLNRGEDLDMNVEEAWEEGVTGKGVAVTILDDGKLNCYVRLS